MSEVADSIVEIPQAKGANGNKEADSDVATTVNEHDSNTAKQAPQSAQELKMDELTSLEREIAELHHVEPSTPSIAQKVNEVHISNFTNDDYHNSGGKVILEMQPPQCKNSTPAGEGEDKNGAHSNNGVEGVHKAMEEEDLIAVLKGVENEQKSNDSSIAGVTIEGEGEFQIMEIDDDEPEDEEAKMDVS